MFVPVSTTAFSIPPCFSLLCVLSLGHWHRNLPTHEKKTTDSTRVGSHSCTVAQLGQEGKQCRGPSATRVDKRKQNFSVIASCHPSRAADPPFANAYGIGHSLLSLVGATDVLAAAGWHKRSVCNRRTRLD